MPEIRRASGFGMDDKIYNAVIPLGGWCRLTYQVRRYFGFKTAYPFDWLVTPHHAALSMIEDDFSRMLDPAQLRLREDRDGVICRTYDLQHKHDFLRDGAHNTKPNFLEQIGDVRRKFQYRINNLHRDTRRGPTLFVRHDDTSAFDKHNEDGLKYSRANIDDARRLMAALRYRFPNTDVTLLVVNFAADGSDDPRIIVSPDAADHGDRSTGDWAGSDRGWDEVLARSGARKKEHDVVLDPRGDISEVNDGYW